MIMKKYAILVQYIVLLTTFFITIICISSKFFYFHLYLRKSDTGVSTETVIY